MYEMKYLRKKDMPYFRKLAEAGKAIIIERGRRRITPDPVKGLMFAKIWHVVGRLYRTTRKTAAQVYHNLQGKQH